LKTEKGKTRGKELKQDERRQVVRALQTAGDAEEGRRAEGGRKAR